MDNIVWEIGKSYRSADKHYQLPWIDRQIRYNRYMDGAKVAVFNLLASLSLPHPCIQTNRRLSWKQIQKKR